MQNYTSLTIKSEIKQQIIDLRDQYGFEGINAALLYALQAARDAKKLEIMLGVNQ